MSSCKACNGALRLAIEEVRGYCGQCYESHTTKLPSKVTVHRQIGKTNIALASAGVTVPKLTVTPPNPSVTSPVTPLKATVTPPVEVVSDVTTKEQRWAESHKEQRRAIHAAGQRRRRAQ